MTDAESYLADPSTARRGSFETVPTRRRRIGPANCFRPFRLGQGARTIAERFEQQAGASPERIAVKTRDTALTYEALNRAANAVAWAILALRGSPEYAVGLLFPQARLRHMVQQTRPTVLVTNDANVTLARDLGAFAVVNIDELDCGCPTSNPGLTPSLDDAVAISYTSGSTGEPKGVVWSHKGILRARS